MRKQFHSGNILNKKFHLEMVRDLKADCAKRTEEVCSGFCNIGSGVSLKRQKWHQKAKNCFLVFFYVQAGGRREDKNKQKRKQRRAKRKKEARDNLTKEEILQDDRFFCIAGYTSGGAPYGVTWEEMGLKPWEDLEENNWVVSAILFISCDRNRFPFCRK